MTFLFSARKWVAMVAACMAVLPSFSNCATRIPGIPIVAVGRIVDDSINADILFYVNQYRQSKGLAPLQMNPVVSAEAKKHSTAMALQRTPFGHDGFEGRFRMIVQQLGPLRRSAENVAYGYLTAKQVVDGWIKSPGHRKNIEGNYTLTGIGVASSKEGTVFFTQIFASK